ncbi:AIR synthase related protein [Orenia marismortui]|uniref:Alpha-ribazole kinase n=1 Tax=Orenia marismortui TaxID=46469 RepID=A0A4R8HBA6_9FIRM|nr:AIR synthase related protein [Orenia marismortui]TDX52999.1 alpha-ribazole kinase [Orenia marismortui]
MNNFRDISILKLDDEKILVVACDSAGGIGSKIEDKIKISNQIAGKFTARVALMELLASGAKPISIIDTLSVELEPTGKEIIAGIKEELFIVGIENLLTGSTEENITTVQTGIGVTAIGIATLDQLRLAISQKGDLIVALGLPKVGYQVVEDRNQIADLELILKTLELDYIHEILPVGSKGISYEANVLAKSNQLNLELLNSELDLAKSAGPATVVLVSIAESDLLKLKEDIDKPINLIGRLDN